MGLAIRMIIYLASGIVAGFGWASFDETAGTLTLDLDAIATILGGLITFVGTFISSRFAKARGGAT